MSEQFYTGQVIEVFVEEGLLVGKVSVNGAITRVALGLVPGICVGDSVLVHAGVAVGKVEMGGQDEVSEHCYD